MHLTEISLGSNSRVVSTVQDEDEENHTEIKWHSKSK